jgi:hypothetical protein
MVKRFIRQAAICAIGLPAIRKMTLNDASLDRGNRLGLWAVQDYVSA